MVYGFSYRNHYHRNPGALQYPTMVETRARMHTVAPRGHSIIIITIIHRQYVRTYISGDDDNAE